MAEQESSFRDFGILPVGLKPPADRVRCFLSTGRVVGQWIGGGTHTGDAFDDMPIGALATNTGKTMRFTGISILKVVNGLITEELGLDEGVTVLEQLGLIKSS